LPLRPDEDDTVPGGIDCVPFHLLVGHRDPSAVPNHALAFGDGGDIAVALDFEVVGLEGVRLAATGDAWIVRLLERLKPSTHIFGLVRPLSIIAGLAVTTPIAITIGAMIRIKSAAQPPRSVMNSRRLYVWYSRRALRALYVAHNIAHYGVAEWRLGGTDGQKRTGYSPIRMMALPSRC
jgi:hypothetical protein